MAGSTMVRLTHATEGRREEYFQPWVIERVRPWGIGPDERTEIGSWVHLDDGETVLRVAESAEEVQRRVDAAQEAIDLRTAEILKQPTNVVVTNWMAQFWVLVVANIVLDVFVRDWSAVGRFVVTKYIGFDPYFWVATGMWPQ